MWLGLLRSKSKYKVEQSIFSVVRISPDALFGGRNAANVAKEIVAQEMIISTFVGNHAAYQDLKKVLSNVHNKG